MCITDCEIAVGAGDIDTSDGFVRSGCATAGKVDGGASTGDGGGAGIGDGCVSSALLVPFAAP